MATPSNSKKVLIIDDEQDIVDLISEVLSRERYEPIVATRWTEAIEAITSAQPDLILLDLKMPTIDGSAILEFVRKEGIPLPVIVVSGFLTADAVENLSSLGVSAFIRKPFKVAQLKAEIERAIGSAQPAEVEPTAPETTSSSSERELLGAFQKLQAGESEPAEKPPGPTREETEEEPAHDTEILQAFEKLGSPSGSPAPPPNATSRSAEHTDRPSSPEEVAKAFRKLSGEPPAAAPAPEPASPAPTASEGSPPPPAETLARGGGQQARTHDADVRIPLDGQERRTHRTHAHRRHRPRGASRRNFLYMGVITVVCIAIAAFLSLMQWYASQVSVEEIKAGAQKSLTEQMKEELKKELQKGN